MEKGDLIIVSVIFVSLLVLAFSVGKITGLITDDVISMSPREETQSEEEIQCNMSCVEEICKLKSPECIQICEEHCKNK